MHDADPTEREYDCPSCGERNATAIDPQSIDHEFVEDCWVCCRPAVVRVRRGVSGPELDVRAEDD